MLLAARLLIAFVRFGRWRGTLGSPTEAQGPPGSDDPAGLRPVLAAHRRALVRLPLRLKCLPRSMALHWMLRRRGIASVLAIGALPRHGRGRGHIDDLHAWVWVNGQVRHGESDQPYVELLRLG